MRDEEFNRYRPMFPQSKVWKAKAADQPDRPVGPPQPTGQTGHEDRSDRSDQPVRPVEPSAKATAESVPPVSVPSVLCCGGSAISFFEYELNLKGTT